MANYDYWKDRTDKAVRSPELNNLVQSTRHFVVEGCEVTAAGADLDVDIALGEVFIDAQSAQVGATSVTLSAGDGSDPRVDLVVVDNTGTVSVIEGTPSSVPVNADYDPNTYVVLAFVIVPTGAAVINDSDVFNIGIFAEGFSHVRTGTSDPASGDNGELFFNTTSSTLKFWNGSSWEDAGSDVGGSDLLPDTDNTHDIGEDSTPLRWKDVYIAGHYKGSALNFIPLASGSTRTNELFVDSGDNTLKHSNNAGTNYRVALTEDNDFGYVDVIRFRGDDTSAPTSTLVGFTEVLSFDPDTDQIVYASVELPDDMDTSSDITVDVHYTVDTSETADIKLNLDANVITDGDDTTPASPTESTTDTFTAVATAEEFDVHSSTALKVSAANITDTNDRLFIKFTRDADDAGDTHTGNFLLERLQFKYTRLV